MLLQIISTMDPRSPILFLADFALNQAKSPMRPKGLMTPVRSKVPEFQTPLTRSKIGNPEPPFSPTKAKTDAKTGTNTGTNTGTKASMLSRGACAVHFKKRGKPSTFQDVLDCISGKCGKCPSATADAPALDASPAVKPVAAPPAAFSSDKTAVFEAVFALKQAKLAMFAANAALVKAERTLEKFM